MRGAKATIEVDAGSLAGRPAPNGRSANPRSPDGSLTLGSVGAKRAHGRQKNGPAWRPAPEEG